MDFVTVGRLSVNDVVFVARKKAQVKLGEESKNRINACRKKVEEIEKSGKLAYGIRTGFGDLKHKVISDSQIHELQRNLILSHAAGVGQMFSEEVVRAAMLVRLNSLAQGYSGIRIEVANTLVEMLNKRVHPVVPEQGSVGASGDLSPLSHVALVMIGEGEAFFEGHKMAGKEAMTKANIPVLELKSKEGLALNNGTAFMAGGGVLALHDAMILSETADVSGAMSLEALMGSKKPFDEKVHIIRSHKGQKDCAKHVLSLLEGSEIIASHENCNRVQDAYSLRCIPQVHGASRDALAYVQKVLETEINAVTDNPLIFEDGEVVSAGNFHGQPLALALDFLAIAVSELADISERRTARLLDARLNEGLPAFLVQEGGLNSGFMIAQYTAASLVSENKVLSHPASVDSIPTSANQEDHVSMGSISARKAGKVVENAENVLAIELLCAAQALDFRKPLKPGRGSRQALETIREVVSFLSHDRELHKDILAVKSLIKQEKFANVRS